MGTRIIVFRVLCIEKIAPDHFGQERFFCEIILFFERLFDCNCNSDDCADHGREMLGQHFGRDRSEPPVAVRHITHGSGEETNYFLSASSTATATATVAPTMGLLPMPRKPIIST